ncbi:MAG: phosphotransferase [Proteobacteria bacterium]|nr:phosphotransferase [Pseudomonadota bacterium]NIS71034.1 phosphotransferase [Pseudomonadota bacterium]
MGKNEAMVTEQFRDIIAKNYQIGDLKRIEKLQKGYVNISYEVETLKDGQKGRYFFRRYKDGIKEEEVQFEHAIIGHLVKKDFGLVAPLVRTRDGRTYVKQLRHTGRKENGDDVFFSLFEFLSGDDRYTWDHPDCSDTELRKAAAVLAQYHAAVIDLVPEGRRFEPKILHLLPVAAENVRAFAKRAGSTEFDAYFLENLDLILDVIDLTRRGMDEKGYKEMIHLAVHGDFHPGNLKFQNDDIAGLFDFDWTKMDARCFDVGLAITYFCTTWDGERDGDLRLDKAAGLVKAYQGALTHLKGLPPLNHNERQYLPAMINASNIYVLNWDLQDFYTKKVSPDEYLRYLKHSVRFMTWLEDETNQNKLERTIRDASQG